MAAQAILQYRNTPIQGIGLSPAQLLLHRSFRDYIPSHPYLYKPHPEWIAAAQKREKTLSKRNADLIKRYNRTAHALSLLRKRDTVSIQTPNSHRWDIAGRIVETLPNRQYRIRVAGTGRITLRNRRFLRKLKIPIIESPIPSALPLSPEPTITDMSTPHQPANKTGNGGITLQRDLESHRQAPPSRTRIPRALSRLFPYNRPGNKELIPPQRPLCFCDGERRQM